MYRLQGELLLHLGADQPEVEQSFIQFLEVAREQQAVVLELQTAISLSRLWIEQSRTLEVPELPRPVIARFDEDSDNSDLNQARKLVAVNG